MFRNRFAFTEDAVMAQAMEDQGHQGTGRKDANDALASAKFGRETARVEAREIKAAARRAKVTLTAGEIGESDFGRESELFGLRGVRLDPQYHSCK